jgi:hypothetical protein
VGDVGGQHALGVVKIKMTKAWRLAVAGLFMYISWWLERSFTFWKWFLCQNDWWLLSYEGICKFDDGSNTYLHSGNGYYIAIDVTISDSSVMSDLSTWKHSMILFSCYSWKLTLLFKWRKIMI